jgi:ribosome biogenesis GTPase
MSTSLSDLGWNDFFEKYFQPYQNSGLIPARVSCEHKNLYSVLCTHGETVARVAGSYRYTASSRTEYPRVGDWVAVSMQDITDPAIIHNLLPRKTWLSRKVAWTRTEEQILAANIDIAFLISGMDGEFNIQRIERYLTMCYNRDLRSVIILNKQDLCEDIENRVQEIESIAFDIPVHAISALTSANINQLRQYLTAGKTAVCLGSSGVGKSTIINRLLGKERLPIGDISESTGKGKHITVQRELIPLSSGGLLIDTPGLRELQLWGDEGDVNDAFHDIEQLSRHCRFRDCRHRKEPGCAVKNAIQDGRLDIARYRNYLKLQRELRFLNTRRRQKMHCNRRKMDTREVKRRKDLY